MAALALALMLLAVATNALVRLHDGKAALPALPPPLPEWIDVPRPVHMFALETPVFHGLPSFYEARRRTAEGGWEDVLAYGTPGHDATALRLRLERRGARATAQPPLVAAIASQAADAGLSVERAGLADLLPTRFGEFEIAGVTLTDGAALRLPCSGFRLALDTPPFTISGLACGTVGKPLEQATLACLVDQLDFVSGGDDQAMKDFFAASEGLRGLSCAGIRLVPDDLRGAWLHDKPVTHSKRLVAH